MLETELAGTPLDEYVFFNGKRIARRKASGEVNYYFSDHLGSSRVVANASGQVLDDSDFYPFGGERIVVSSSGNNYKFTGQERDSESNLHYFGARHYAPSYGRFLQPDPLFGSTANPQSLNRYAYTLNNPLRFIDPTGEELVTFMEAGHTVTVDTRIEQQTRKLLRLLTKGAAVTSSFRTTGKQAVMYKEWLEGKRRFEVAEPRSSRHEAGFAIDVGIQNVASLDEKTIKKLRVAIQATAEAAGFTPGSVSDPVHFPINPEAEGTTFQEALSENQVSALVLAKEPEPIPLVLVPVGINCNSSPEICKIAHKKQSRNPYRQAGWMNENAGLWMPDHFVLPFDWATLSSRLGCLLKARIDPRSEAQIRSARASESRRGLSELPSSRAPN